METSDRPHRRPPLVEEGYRAWRAEDWRRAGSLLEQAVRADPDGGDSAELWFDAALAYKFLRDWPKAYELGREAAARSPRDREDPAYWNLGIAATVLRDWATARDCWAGYGLRLPPGDGEIVADLGATAVRITTPSGQEVVWARRLCPTRARVISVPFDPVRRFGETVLHDGAPNGERIVDGHTFPVFDEIMLFDESPLATLSATVTAATADDIRTLVDAFQDHGLGADVVGTGAVLCRCCSEGSRPADRTVTPGRHNVLLAAEPEVAADLLDAWRAGRPDDRSWTNLHRAT